MGEQQNVRDAILKIDELTESWLKKFNFFPVEAKEELREVRECAALLLKYAPLEEDKPKEPVDPDGLEGPGD